MRYLDTEAIATLPGRDTHASNRLAGRPQTAMAAGAAKGSRHER